MAFVENKKSPWIASVFLKWLLMKGAPSSPANDSNWRWMVRLLLTTSPGFQGRLWQLFFRRSKVELMLIAAHFVFCLFGLLVLSVSSHILLHYKETVLDCLSLLAPSPSPFLFFPMLCCWCFSFSPKIKRHTPIYSTGNKDKSERLSRRWVFCLTNPDPPWTLFPLSPYRRALPGNLLAGDDTFPAARAEVI